MKPMKVMKLDKFKFSKEGMFPSGDGDYVKWSEVRMLLSVLHSQDIIDSMDIRQLLGDDVKKPVSKWPGKFG